MKKTIHGKFARYMVLSIFSAVLFLSLSLHLSAQAVSGDGTANNPYVIATEGDLRGISQGLYSGTLSAHYVLKNDITLSDEAWTPVGSFDTPFTGVFDGKGYAIRNLHINADQTHTGLFGLSNGTIQNLTVEASASAGNLHIGAVIYLGAVVGENLGTVTDCHAIADFNLQNYVVAFDLGALIGENCGTVRRCSAEGLVRYANTSGHGYAGGLIGYDYLGTVEDCWTKATVKNESRGSSTSTGGLIGECYSSTVKRCYAAGTISTASGSVGGVYGLQSYATFIGNYYDQTLSGINKVLAGATPLTSAEMKNKLLYSGWDFENNWTISSYVNDAYPTLKPGGSHTTAPISGSGTAADPYRVENEKQLAAIAAGDLPLDAHYSLQNDITLIAKSWMPIGNADDFTGVFNGNGHTIRGIKCIANYTYAGLFGVVTGTVRNLSVETYVNTDSFQAGALAGYSNGLVENCNAVVEIDHTGSEIYATYSMGGLLGSNAGTVRRCYAAGSIVCADAKQSGELGGLIGNNRGNVEDCFAIVSLLNRSGYTYARTGGLAGFSYGGSIKRCYAAGQVTGSVQSRTGGFVGEVNFSTNDAYNTLFLFNCYDRNATGQSDAEKGASPFSPAEMQNPNAYTGWDLQNNWTIKSGVNNGYPTLIPGGQHKTPAIKGAGTAADPYQIENEAQLVALSGVEYPLNAHYKLMGDITLQSLLWSPIGYGYSGEAFSGVFDGNDHSIRGVRMSPEQYTKNQVAGLFGFIASKATVCNLHVEADLSVGLLYAGVLAGENSGTVRGCSTAGSVECTKNTDTPYAGGLIGYNAGKVEDCYSLASVTNNSTNTNSATGGLIGTACSGVVKRCYAAGKVTGKSPGGLFGRIESNALSLFNYYDGSVAGQSDEDKGAYRLTSVEAKDQASYTGFDFQNNWAIDPAVNNGYPYRMPGGKHVPAELKGVGIEASPYLIENEEQLITVAMGEVYGAFSSWYLLQNDIELSAKFWTPIGGNGQPAFTGVFDGNGHTISGLRIPQFRFVDGGFFGTIMDTDREDTVISGLVYGLGLPDAKVKGIQTAGALAGLVSEGGRVLGCFSTGEVECTVNAGGLVGRVTIGQVSFCYARTSAASTAWRAGGLIGYADSILVAEFNYAAGAVSGNATGGLIGALNLTFSQLSENYFDRTVAGQSDDNKGARGMTTAQLKNQANLPNWDFVSTWIMSPLYNDGYPFLRIFIPVPKQVEAPTANPPAGEVFRDTKISLNTETEGASIYYTTNGTVPTAQSTLYTQPIVLKSDMVIRAIAIKEGMIDSDLVTFIYTLSPIIPVTDLSLDRDSLSLEAGTSETLTASLKPDDASDKRLAWSSDNPAVATVDASGKVSALSAGKVNITVQSVYDNTKTAVCAVTVTPKKPVFSLSSASAKPGESFEVTVSVANNPGISFLTIAVAFDTDKLEWDYGGAAYNPADPNTWPFRVGEIAEMSTGPAVMNGTFQFYKPIEGEGTLLTLKLKVKDDVPVGEVPLLLPADSLVVLDSTGADMPATVSGGTVHVTAKTPGDANGDGVVNLPDAILIAQYVAGWDVDIDLKAANVTGSSAVNLADAIWIAQYVAGWHGQ